MLASDSKAVVDHWAVSESFPLQLPMHLALWHRASTPRPHRQSRSPALERLSEYSKYAASNMPPAFLPMASPFNAPAAHRP